MASSTTTNAAIDPAPPLALAPRSARTSLKRARVLFDSSGDHARTSSSDGGDNDATAPTTPADPLVAATAAFIPPLFDAQIHKASIERRIKLQYPDEVKNLAFQGEEDEILQEADGKSSKESATLRAVRELRREALDRLRSGEEDGGSLGGDGGEGRLVLHREKGMNSAPSAPSAAAAAAVAANGGALVLAGGTKAGDAKSTTRKEGQKIRPGGILVEWKDSNANIPTPQWHAPCKLSTVISSHLGWVRSVAFAPSNTLFATGGGDRVIKVFDLAKACVVAPGALKITLPGHISPIHGLAFSERHPYLFSAGEDKMVKCWDLETNQSSTTTMAICRESLH